jgi:hypothetical protein
MNSRKLLLREGRKNRIVFNDIEREASAKNRHSLDKRERDLKADMFKKKTNLADQLVQNMADENQIHPKRINYSKEDLLIEDYSELPLNTDPNY